MYDAAVMSIPSEYKMLRDCTTELAMRRLAGHDPVDTPSTIPGMIVKCPHCKEKSFVPILDFNGNVGEIRGKCHNCMGEIYILSIVCRGEEVENIVKDVK